MSRFVTGFSDSDARQNAAPVLVTGGSTIGTISTSSTPTGNAAIRKDQADALASGGGGSSANGVRVLTVVAGQTTATGSYSHSTTTSCNFTVPANTTRLYIQVWGGGGGGGGPRCRAIGVPGGVGGYTHGSFTVVPGDIICIQAGRGGCRGCCFRHGFAGTISYACNATRGIQIRAYPGAGGRCNQENYGVPSGVGSGAGGIVNWNPGTMGSDINCSCHKYCDGRQRAYLNGVGMPGMGGNFTTVVGTAASMCTSANCGMNNPSPGGGGGTSGMSYPTSNKGGAGGPGLVMIWY
jgi:hypothetical protein